MSLSKETKAVIKYLEKKGFVTRKKKKSYVIGIDQSIELIEDEYSSTSIECICSHWMRLNTENTKYRGTVLYNAIRWYDLKLYTLIEMEKDKLAQQNKIMKELDKEFTILNRCL